MQLLGREEFFMRAEAGLQTKTLSEKDRAMMGTSGKSEKRETGIRGLKPFVADAPAPTDRVVAQSTARHAIAADAPVTLFEKPLAETATDTKTIQKAITQARNDFFERTKTENRVVSAYDVEQDMVVYDALQKHQGVEGYETERNNLNAYTCSQLETFIGERLHVGLSTFRYNISEGELQIEGTNEGALEMYKRGRDFRLKHGKEVDFPRESAEVDGFAQIQSFMTNEDTPIGAKAMFVSPPGREGSIYKMNFYDVFEKTSEGVIARRYSSGLTPAESQERLAQLDARYKGNTVPTDAEFLSKPVFLQPGERGINSADDIHIFMHKEHDYTTKEQLDLVIKACQPIINKIVDTLEKTPNDRAAIERQMRVLMNYADEANDSFNKVTTFNNGLSLGESTDYWVPPQIFEDKLAEQKVRHDNTGCGASGDKDESSISSVSEFGKKEKGKNNCGDCGSSTEDNHYHCPGCKKSYSDETSKAAEDRTKSCGCGFEFGC